MKNLVKYIVKIFASLDKILNYPLVLEVKVKLDNIVIDSTSFYIPLVTSITLITFLQEKDNDYKSVRIIKHIFKINNQKK